jgi:hypothetical protein
MAPSASTRHQLPATAAPPPIHHPTSRTQTKFAPQRFQCVGLTPLNDVDLDHGNLNYTVVIGEVLGKYEAEKK